MAQVRTLKTRKYELCCLSNFIFSRPKAQWVVYVADAVNGLIVGRQEAYAAKVYALAKQWAEEHCNEWLICDTP